MKAAVFSKTQNIQGYLHPWEKFAFSMYLFSQWINYLENTDEASKCDCVWKWQPQATWERTAITFLRGMCLTPHRQRGQPHSPEGVGQMLPHCSLLSHPCLGGHRGEGFPWILEMTGSPLTVTLLLRGVLLGQEHLCSQVPVWGGESRSKSRGPQGGAEDTLCPSSLLPNGFHKEPD